MGTPFTAEDQLVKRSLFSSILGVANRLRTTSRDNVIGNSGNDQVQQQFGHQNFEHQQPCCSNQLFAQNVQQQQMPPSILFEQQIQQHSSMPTALIFSPTDKFHSNSSPSGQSSPTAALGHQFGRQLDLNEFFLQPNQPTIEVGQEEPQQFVLSPQSQHEIYREIVRECQVFEQNEQKSGDEITEKLTNQQIVQMEEEEHRIVSAALEALPAALASNSPLTNSLNINSNKFQPEQRLQVNLLSMAPSPPLSTPSNVQWLGGAINGAAAGGCLSLEHLVKIVVATVREVTGSGQQKKSKSEENDKQKEEEQQKNTKGKTANIIEESAEVILERRRQQNNAAAARYRKRQRQVESGLTEELAQLERRNWELRAEVAKCRANIEETNALLKRNREGMNKNM